jgi:ribosomal protein L11 methylase PrmA
MDGKSQSQVIKRLPSSLRDPAGFIFAFEEGLYRAVNKNYKNDFDLLSSSGLYHHLINKAFLVEHDEGSTRFTFNDLDAYKVLKIQKLTFISYPVEWCFGQLKTAALFTLQLQKIALDYGMTLKDASAFNVQYRGAKPIFIDILSFEKYKDGSPWLAYEQFCRHFLAPLALMSYRDDRLQQLLRIYMDGIPLDLATELLPRASYFNLPLLTNIILQAKAQQWFSKFTPTSTPIVKKQALMALIDNLYNLIEGLKVRKKNSAWNNYYEDACIYTNQAMISKHQIIEELLDKAKPKMVWDLGANDGKFSRVASTKNIYTVSMDFDHNSVESNYLNACRNNDLYLLPLLMNIINPSPAQGWSSCETKSLIERGPVDTMLALALIHHLVISHSLSLASIAASFASMCNSLIIEFVPENDPQILYLLRSKPVPSFEELYNIEIFEREFKKHFVFLDKLNIEDSGRIIYFAQKI